MIKDKIFVYWDESRIWGLLLLQAFAALKIPFRLVSASEIRAGILAEDNCGLLIVPGGSARLKAARLGKSGLANIRYWVNKGGKYFGICGGAGLALSGRSEESLGICPWKRATFLKRSSHFLSGHVKAELPDQSLISMPIWWPGRFEAEKDCGITVLARYLSPEMDLMLEDKFYEEDLPNQAEAFPAGQPLAIMGKYGKGKYILSYAHPETPESIQANKWLIKIFENVFAIDSACFSIWRWNIFNIPEIAPETEFNKTMYEEWQNMVKVFQEGASKNIFFPRLSWLSGWRSGIPGIVCNCIAASLSFLSICTPNAEMLSFWQMKKKEFTRLLGFFLAATVEIFRIYGEKKFCDNMEKVGKGKSEVYGHPVSGGGVAGILMDMMDELIYLHFRD